MTATVLDRFLARVVKDPGGCWPWQGCLNSRGYGVISVDGERKLAHRVSYVLHVGPIPDGLTIDHLCRNKPCVNPEHLEPVTVKVNNRRSPSSGYLKPTCFVFSGVYGWPRKVNRHGTRSCRECQNAAKRTNSDRTSSRYWAARRAPKLVPSAAAESVPVEGFGSAPSREHRRAV